MTSIVSSKLLNTLVIVGIFLTLFALAATPLILTAIFKASEFSASNPHTVLYITLGIYLCAIPFLIALFKLKGICKLIFKENAFSLKISTKFRDIAICSFSESIVFLAVEITACLVFHAFMYALTVIPTFIVVFIGITGGFLFLTFSNIFKKANEIKEENDLTF